MSEAVNENPTIEEQTAHYVQWKYRENQDSEFAETKVGDLDVLAQDCDGDFSRWDVRRSGKYLAVGETYGREHRYHFDVAKECAVEVANAILKAERLNEHIASPECANCGYPQYMHDAADHCDDFKSA